MIIIQQELPPCTASVNRLIDYVVESSPAAALRNPCSPITVMFKQMGELFSQPITPGLEQTQWSEWVNRRRSELTDTNTAAEVSEILALDEARLRVILTRAVTALDRQSKTVPHPYYVRTVNQ